MSIQPMDRRASVPCPPRSPRAYLPILGIAGGQVYRLTVITPSLYGLFCHYDGQRTVACQRPHGDCPYHAAGYRCAWYGFLGVLDSKRKPWLVQLTVGAVQWCPALVAADGDLRGRRIEVERMRRHSNSPMRVRLLEGLHPVTGCPEPDLAACAMWLVTAPGSSMDGEGVNDAQGEKKPGKRKGGRNAQA